MSKNGKKTMEMTEIPHHDYPDKMKTLVRHHYNEGSNNFSSENTHYLGVIMCGCYNFDTKKVIDTLVCEGVAVVIQARPR
jgi:hypothetical protein